MENTIKQKSSLSKIITIITALVIISIFKIELIGKVIFWILAAIVAAVFFKRAAYTILGISLIIGAIYLIVKVFQIGL